MTPAIHSLIKKHPVIFGVLVFVGSVVAGMFAILLADSLFAITCKNGHEGGSWAGLVFFATTSPLLLMWSGFNTYCAKKCKPSNTLRWMVATLFLYGYWFSSSLAKSYCN